MNTPQLTQDKIIAIYKQLCRENNIVYGPEMMVDVFREQIRVVFAQALADQQEEIIALSDKIELEGETTLEEWKAFKRFRNTLRDRKGA